MFQASVFTQKPADSLNSPVGCRGDGAVFLSLEVTSGTFYRGIFMPPTPGVSDQRNVQSEYNSCLSGKVQAHFHSH